MIPVLIYVDEPWAYFGILATAWGDDWDDAPYEHNAGEPNGYAFRVAFDGPWELPSTWHTNGPWSVEAINAGGVPWLRTDRYSRPPDISIPAGTPWASFRRLIWEGGGKVYAAAGSRAWRDRDGELVVVPCTCEPIHRRDERPA